MRARRLLTDSSGFTLVEVMVATLILAIGVLGSVTMIDGANRSTARNKAREGATAVARDVAEGAHAVPWVYLDQSSAPGRLQQQPGLADDDSSTAGWQITRRGVAYGIALDVCTVDDPADGLASTHGANFCPVAGSSSSTDANPVDYKRVAITVSWKEPGGATRTLIQTTTVSSSYNGPAVTDVAPPGPSPYTYTGSGTSLTINVTTDQVANRVDWLLGGAKQGVATGSGTAWTFVWPIGVPTGGTAGGTTSCSPTGNGTLDGTYFPGAQAFDANGRSPGPQAATVNLNRCSPLAPRNVLAGKSVPQSKVEVQWDGNDETDIAGYWVYRRATPTGSWTQVATGGCSGLVKKTSCFDDEVTTLSTTYYYRVVAVDRTGGGALRGGDETLQTMLGGNSAPFAPNISASGPGSCPSTLTLYWGSPGDADGDPISYYWVYRTAPGASPTTANRYDAVDDPPPCNRLGWTDPDTTGGPWDYRLTAVDTHGNESGFSNRIQR